MKIESVSEALQKKILELYKNLYFFLKFFSSTFFSPNTIFFSAFKWNQIGSNMQFIREKMHISL